MDLSVLQGHARVDIDDLHSACLCCCVEVLVEGAPCRTRELFLVFSLDFLQWFWSVGTRTCCKDSLKVVNVNMRHSFVLEDDQELLITVSKLDLHLDVALKRKSRGHSAIFDIEDDYTVNVGRQKVL